MVQKLLSPQEYRAYYKKREEELVRQREELFMILITSLNNIIHNGNLTYRPINRDMEGFIIFIKHDDDWRLKLEMLIFGAGWKKYEISQDDVYIQLFL